MAVRTLPLALALAASACHAGGDNGKTVRVAAAADLARAFEELGKAFQARTGIEALFTFGSSGMLAKQIENSAPFYLFAAANREYADEAAHSGHCDAGSISPYARGRIVVWTPSGVAAPKTLAELADARFSKIAIANPEHAPYGQAAQQALEKAGVWEQVKDRIVPGDNVQSALRFAQTRNADAAIVALSLAVVSDGGAFLQIDSALHAPLEQSLVVCGTGAEADRARQLVQFIASPDGREIMTRYGFLLPNEQMSRRP